MKRNIPRTLSSIAVFLIVFLTVKGQEEADLKKLFVEAESYFLFEEYSDALPLYQRVLRAEPENYNVIYKIGICYLNDIYQKEKSIGYLMQASEHTNPKYKQESYKEKMAPVEAYYYLGQAYHVNNQLQKALETYKYFKSIADPAEYDIELVNEDIRACEYAMKLMATPVYFHPVNLGEKINSRFEESNPIISGDGKTLVFTRKLQFYDGVFLSIKDESGNWSEPVNLTGDFGLDGNSYCTGISYFGDEIFVYRSDNYDGNIYYSKKTGNKWSALKPLNANINTKYWESHASLSPDGVYLYFTSNRDGGYGGLDIYRSRRGANGEWGVAVNLGPVINTPANEETPFLANEGYTLFFSSQGHRTIGDYDIFMSNRLSDGSWSKPLNMGVPVNTTDKDVFYSPMNVNSFGLLALYNEASTYGLKDIYQIEVYNELIPRSFTVSGSVDISGMSERDIKNLKVSIFDKKTGELVATTGVNADGTWSVNLPQGDYSVVIEGANFAPTQSEFSLNVAQKNSSVVLPGIALAAAGGAAVVPPVTVPVKTDEQLIVAKRNFYAVSDSAPVAIELLVPKGLEITLETYLADTLYNTDKLTANRRKFTYFYRPQPGENLLVFSALGEDSTQVETEVTVTYYPPVEQIDLTQKEAQKPAFSVKGSYISWVASPALFAYLQKISLEDFDNYYELYEHLSAKAPTEGFTQTDVDKMFSVLFTQRDLNEFHNEFSTDISGNTEQLDEVKNEVRIPIEYVQVLSEQKILKKP